MKQAMPFVIVLAAASAASAASGTTTGALRGVVVAERPSRAGQPQLLIAAPSALADRAVDEIRLDLPKSFRGKLSPDRLPKGWALDLKGRLAAFKGPALAPGNAVALALGKADAGSLGEIGVHLLGGGQELLAGVKKPAALLRAATSAAIDEFLRLPRTAAPGETIDFSPLDESATPPGGAWEIDGAPTKWNGRFEGTSYQWAVPVTAKVGLDVKLSISYTDPWGEKLLDGTWDKTRTVPPSAGTGPRITGCSPKMLANGTLCVCGNFPAAARGRLRVNGQPLGEPVSASNESLHFFLPEGVGAGQFKVTGDADAGFPPADTASGINIGVQGEIDRARLMRGESTPLRLSLQGTQEALSLRLWNTTTTIVSVVGGDDQVVTTSGGPTNEVVRTVNAVSPGDFAINYSLTIDSCPCGGAPAAAPPSTAITTTTRSPIATTTRGPCDASKKECDELRARAESLEEAARSARDSASRAAKDLSGFDPTTLDQMSAGDRAQLDIVRRQAREWRELAAAARASAAKNRERNKKYPGYNWDYWAAFDEEEAARRDAEAEKLERQARDLEARAKEQSERARQLREAKTQADLAAAGADAAASAARAAYEACVAKLAAACPGQTVGTTTRGTAGPTSPGTVARGTDAPMAAPSPTVPPRIYGEEIDNEKLCPQRDGKHASCVALIIDIAKNDDWRPGAVTNTKDALESLKCDVDYVAPTFRSVPPHTYRTEIFSWSEMKWKKVTYTVNTNGAREQALRANAIEKGQIDQAIARHREKLRKGAILGFEMVNGHGSKQGGGSCGSFGPSFDWANNSIERAAFYRGNYDAAKGNVCQWYTAELACYSRATARIVDNLNNRGYADCSGESIQNRSFHAGYESDIVHTCGKKGFIEACTNYDVIYLADDIDDALEDEAGRQSQPGYGPKTAFKQGRADLRDAADSAIFSFSTYADQGYEMCVPESHTQRGPY